MLAWVEDKIALLSGIPAGHGEVCSLPIVPPNMTSPLGQCLPQCTPQILLSVPSQTDTIVMCLQPFNVLRYDSGQHYDSHYDVFDPESYGPQTSQRVRSTLASGGLVSVSCVDLRWDSFHVRPQMATVLIYLSDVNEGGETVFPLEGRSGLDRLATIDYRKCNQGLRVRIGARSSHGTPLC